MEQNQTNINAKSQVQNPAEDPEVLEKPFCEKNLNIINKINLK